jgi:hypothetical protein
MYLTMTDQDFQDVIQEAPIMVARRIGVSSDQDPSQLLEAIEQQDKLASGLLNKFIDAYTEWWQTSSKLIQGEKQAPEMVDDIQKLIDKRSQIRLALLNYLNSQYPLPA